MTDPSSTTSSAGSSAGTMGTRPEALLRALTYGSIVLLVVFVVSLIVAGALFQVPGVWSAVIGSAIAGIFELITVIVVLATRNLRPTTTMAVVMGSWIAKIIIALVCVAAIRDMDFYNRPSLVIIMVITMITVLGAETWGIKKTQIPYVDPV